MTNRARNAIRVFLEAIEDGTLANGDYNAGPVGHLIADGKNLKVYVSTFEGIHDYSFYWTKPGKKRKVHSNFMAHIRSYNGKIIFRDPQKVFDPNPAYDTDFSLKELAGMMYMFDEHTNITLSDYPYRTPEEIRQDLINGIKHVVLAILDYDDCNEDVDEVFTKKAESIPLNKSPSRLKKATIVHDI